MTALLGLLLTVAGVPALAAADSPPAADLSAAVPADAVFVALTSDAPRLVEGWSATPLARMWSDPQMQRFFAPLRASLEIERWDDQTEEETGYTVEELLEFLSGEVVLYVSADALEETEINREEEATDSGEELPELVVLADVGERTAEFEELLLHLDEINEMEWEERHDDREYARITRDYRDVTMHIDLVGADGEAEERDAWAVFGSTFAMAANPELLEAAINNVLEGGADEPLTDSDSFRSVAAHLAGGDFSLYANLDRIMPFVREMIGREATPRSGADGEPASAPPMIPPELIFDALGLDVLQAAFMRLSLDSGVIALDSGVSFSDSRGLVQAVAYIPGGAPQPEAIPGNAFDFSAGAFDFQVAWAAAEKIANAVKPGLLPMVAAQVHAVAENAGVELDLRRDVLDNLGTEFFTAHTPLALASADAALSVAAQSQVIAIQIRQRQGLELAIETLKAMAGQGSELFQTRDFLGTQIHTAGTAANGASDDPGAAYSFSYALTDALLLIGIGSPSALESVLIKLQKPGPSVWDQGEVRRALTGLPSGAAVVQYQDLAATGHKAFEMMAYVAKTAEGEELGLCDPTALPSKEAVASYLGSAVSGIYRDASTLVLRMRLLSASGNGE